MVFPISQDDIKTIRDSKSEDALFDSSLSELDRHLIFLENLKTVVTKNSPTDEKEKKFANALEAVAIMLMYPDSFLVIAELKSIFDKQKKSPQDIRKMAEWVYQHPKAIDMISKKYDENTDTLRADSQHTSARHQMLRTFVPLCLSQVTNVHDIGRMFNRGDMKVDKLTTAYTLVQHFASLEDRIAKCDHHNESALEATILAFTHEMLIILLQDFKACFPSGDTFDNDCKKMEGFSEDANIRQKRNESICHLMSIQLSRLMNECTTVKTMNGKFCSLIAEKAIFFLASNAIKALDKDNFYWHFEKELNNSLSPTASTPYSQFGFNLDENGNQLTFSSVALNATSMQLDTQNASKTLADMLKLRGALPEPLLVQNAAALWVAAAHNRAIEASNNTLIKNDHHFTDSLVEDTLERGSKFLNAIFFEALLNTARSHDHSALKNIISIVFRVIDAKDNTILRKEIFDTLSNFQSTQTFQDSGEYLKNAVDAALISPAALKVYDALPKFAEKLKTAIAQGDSNELKRLANLLPQADDYKTRFLTALDAPTKNTANLENDWIAGYLEEHIDKLQDLDPNEKSSMQAILASNLYITNKLKILGAIADGKITGDPETNPAIQKFFSALSHFQNIESSNIDATFKAFIQDIHAKNIDYDPNKFKRNLQHRILRESNLKAENFETQFTRWVNFSNTSQYVVTTEDLISISARLTEKELQACAEKIQNINLNATSISREPSIHESPSLTPKQPLKPNERAAALEEALYNTVTTTPKIIVHRRDRIYAHNTSTTNSLDVSPTSLDLAQQRSVIASRDATTIKSPEYSHVLQRQDGVSNFVDKVLLSQLKAALQQFTGYYISSLFRAHAPQGMQTIIDHINGHLNSNENISTKIPFVLQQLQEIAAEKITDNYSQWAGWGGRRSGETQEAYKVMHGINNHSKATQEENRKILEGLIQKLNAVHTKHHKLQKQQGERIQQDVSIRIELRM